jgi:hypothetical protein
MVKQGIVRQAGPFRDGSGGLLVYDVADENELVPRLPTFARSVGEGGPG